MLRYVFDGLGLNKLCCEVLDTNRAVVDMHKRFGFQEEGLFRRHICKKGVWHDVVALAMLRDGWLALKPKIEARLSAKDLIAPGQREPPYSIRMRLATGL